MRLPALLVIIAATLGAVEAPLTIALPAQSDLTKLADLVAQFAGVSVQYNPQKVTGTVRLAVRGELTAPELWEVFNQVLVGQNLTTVITGEPRVYQIVPINEASGLSGLVDSPALKAMAFTPGYIVVVHELAHLAPEAAVKAIAALFGSQASQARTLGQDARRIVLAAPTSKVREALAVLQTLDRPGVEPAVRMFRPERATPQSLQLSATAAWNASARINGQNRPGEVQIAPDGVQLLLIASTEDADELEQLVRDLDRTEPVETKSYRPRSFGVDEVGNLLTQVLRGGRGDAAGQQPDVVRDKLTGSLIVKASAAQHQRVEELLRMLDDAPAASRRQVRTFTVKNRQADELALVLTGLISSGVVDAGGVDQSGARTAPAPTTTGAPTSQQPGTPPANALPNTPLPPAAPAAPVPAQAVTAVAGVVQDGAVVITADALTNRLIVLGEPRALDQVATLVAQLDKRQPQVDIEVILVALSQTQDRDLGVELAGQITEGSLSYAAASLFDLSGAAAGAPIDRQLPLTGAGSLTGFGGVVLRPGDFAVVLRALEGVTKGKSLIRSHVVVNNNAKATIDGVVQEPLTSINSSSTVSTTSVTGTTDAGTQIAITPTISLADYLTVAYTISQSAFLGESTVSNGTVVPPTKRADSVASVATIPDGHVIAVGGLSNRTVDSSESRVPWLGSIPILGHLFKRERTSKAESRFYVFIRAGILRNESFADLRHLSSARSASAEIEDGWPTLEPALVE